MHDYIHQDIFGYWEEIKHHPILNVYTGLNLLNFPDTFFALNIQILNPKKIPSDNCKKIVISYHTEYFEHQQLWDFFLQLVIVDAAPTAEEPSAISVIVTGAGAKSFLPSLAPCDLRTQTDAARALAQKLAALQGKVVELAVQGTEIARALVFKLVSTETLV